MNTNMYYNPILQDNIAKLRRFGIEVLEPASGYLACGDTGAGKMPEPSELLEYILRDIALPKDMKGYRVCITAGPTQEAIDPVRYISNHSTGKMGYALAKNAMLRGAEVTLVAGPTNLPDVPFVKMVHITSAQDMYEAVTEAAKESDIIVKAAAVADYRPAAVSDEKIKKSDGEMSIALERTKDIIGTLGAMENKRIFNGNTECTGKFQKEAGKEKSGYGDCQQSESRRSRLRDRYKCHYNDYKDGLYGISENE